MSFGGGGTTTQTTQTTIPPQLMPYEIAKAQYAVEAAASQQAIVEQVTGVTSTVDASGQVTTSGTGAGSLLSQYLNAAQQQLSYYQAVQPAAQGIMTAGLGQIQDYLAGKNIVNPAQQQTLTDIANLTIKQGSDAIDQQLQDALDIVQNETLPNRGLAGAGGTPGEYLRTQLAKTASYEKGQLTDTAMNTEEQSLLNLQSPQTAAQLVALAQGLQSGQGTSLAGSTTTNYSPPSQVPLDALNTAAYGSTTQTKAPSSFGVNVGSLLSGSALLAMALNPSGA